MNLNRNDNYEQLTDLEIWNLFRSGSHSAFEFIYQKYFDKLFNYGCQFTKDHSLVEDALQDLFLELNRRKEHLAETNKILPYLYSSFRRKIIRFRDRLSRFRELDSSHSFEFVVSIEDAIIDNDSKEENLKRLRTTMNGLSEKHREVIFLFYYENLSYEEIMVIQGFENIKSARNLLYKALSYLRKSMLCFLCFLHIWRIEFQL